MKFGVFDHLDDARVPVHQLYADRLTLVEAYDRAGLYGYHLAEHHSTPIGMAASPSLMMAAISQRTKNIKFGPMVYLLPFYNPLRLAEEVSMLDHMSMGRFQLGIGRGASPLELPFYQIKVDETASMFEEAHDILMQGLTKDTIAFEGKHYNVRNVPMMLKPFQKPYPPIWYGLTTSRSAGWAGEQGFNILMIGDKEFVKGCIKLYREGRARSTVKLESEPLLGMNRHVVVADTDVEALAIARRAYVVWRENFRFLFTKGQIEPPPAVAAAFPPTFDGLAELGNGIAGSPETVRNRIADQIKETGVNYFVTWLAFGDLTLKESLHSLDLYARKVIPSLVQTCH